MKTAQRSPDSTLQNAARRAARGPLRHGGWSLPPAVATLVVFAGLVFVCTLILLVIWRHPIPAPEVLPGIDALATALTLNNACWFALGLVELAACRLKGVRVDRTRVPVLLAALVLTALLQGLAGQLHAFARF